MDIVRNPDGSLVVPVTPDRHHASDENVDASSEHEELESGTRLLHPGEGGYNEALAEWDLQQNPDHAQVVSTASGRDEAMRIVHAVAASPDDAIDQMLNELEDPEAAGEALQFVLVGGTHSVEAFSGEVAEAKGGDPLPAHEMTKIIGRVLAELDG